VFASEDVFAFEQDSLTVRSVCVIVIWLLALPVAQAAEIVVKPLEGGATLIAIDGELELSDIDSFRSKTELLPVGRTTIEFRSKGGKLLAGIRIGAQIRAKRFNTVVPDGAQCASACALAWLGGARRFVGENSNVGFHTAYILKTGGPAESGPGNAILGAYLNQLGLSEEAILYITYAAPTSVHWMSLEEAAEYGIVVAKLPQTGVSPEASDAVGTQHPQGSSEQRAIDFVHSLYERWSGPNAELMPVLDNLYTEKVLYHGKSTSRQSVLLSKRRFAQHWTQRYYAIRPGSLSATCAAAGGTCRVKGTMSWKLHEAKTTAASRGVASFAYSIVLKDSGPQISAESDTVNDKPSTTSSSLGTVGRSIQHLLAQLSKPSKAPTKAAAAKAPAARPKAPVAQ
jgi:hypothetical protein